MTYLDELELSPFVASAIGEHGAFLFRENVEHVKRCRPRVAERQLAEVSFKVSRDSRLKPLVETRSGSMRSTKATVPQEIALISGG